MASTYGSLLPGRAPKLHFATELLVATASCTGVGLMLGAGGSWLQAALMAGCSAAIWIGSSLTLRLYDPRRT